MVWRLRCKDNNFGTQIELNGAEYIVTIISI